MGSQVGQNQIFHGASIPMGEENDCEYKQEYFKKFMKNAISYVLLQNNFEKPELFLFMNVLKTSAYIIFKNFLYQIKLLRLHSFVHNVNLLLLGKMNEGREGVLRDLEFSIKVFRRGITDICLKI